MIKKNLKLIASVGITAGFIAYVYVYRHSIFGSFENIKTIYLIPVIAGQVGIQVFNAALLRDTLKPLKVRLDYIESFRLTIVASFINFFTPVVGGASVRAVYLKREHKLPYSSFIGVIYANYLIIFIVSFLAGLLGLLSVKGSTTKSAGEVVAIFFAAGTVGSFLFMRYGHRLTGWLARLKINNRQLKKIIEKVGLVDQGWGIIRADRRTLLMMTIWSVATTFSVALLYWGAMKSLGINAGINVALVYSALAIVGLLFNITPGSLGIREAVYASIYSVTAIGAQKVVAFSLMDRATQLILLGIGWVIFSRSIIKKFSKVAEPSTR